MSKWTIFFFICTNALAMEIPFNKSSEILFVKSNIHTPKLINRGIDVYNGEYLFVYRIKKGINRRGRDPQSTFTFALPSHFTFQRVGNHLHVIDNDQSKAYLIAETSRLRGPIKWGFTDNVKINYDIKKIDGRHYFILNSIKIDD